MVKKRIFKVFLLFIVGFIFRIIINSVCNVNGIYIFYSIITLGFMIINGIINLFENIDFPFKEYNKMFLTSYNLSSNSNINKYKNKTINMKNGLGEGKSKVNTSTGSRI